MILLGVGAFVIDVQGRDNSLRDNARAASAVGDSRFLQLTAEDQLHLFRSAQIDVLVNDLLKETAPARGPVPDLSERKISLQDG